MYIYIYYIWFSGGVGGVFSYFRCGIVGYTQLRSESKRVGEDRGFGKSP